MKESKGNTEKIKLYEVDIENNSQQAFENTKIFESHLIKKVSPDFEKLLYQELSKFDRNYPIIIDVGVKPSYDVLKSLSVIVDDTNISEFVFIVPVKSGNVDANNASSTIREIKKLAKNVNILIVCADSGTDIVNEDDMKLEFNKIFGTLYKWFEKKYTPNIFKSTGIPENFVHIPRNIYYDRMIDTMKSTFYEAIEEGRLIREAQMSGKSHEWLDMLSSVREKQIKAKDKKEIEALRAEYERISMQMGFFKKALLHYGSIQQAIFKKFDKVFLTQFFSDKRR